LLVYLSIDYSLTEKELIMIVILYLGLCLLCGYWGRNTFAGPVGFFLLSLMLTPFVGLLILIFAHKKDTTHSQDT
tara:strand:- start:28112 stop:28336 length:225 start_codon:yes stop_codon:yes gene_type:complete